MSCHKQTKDATLPKVGEVNAYTKKSHIHALSACFSLGAYASTYTSYTEEESSIWQYWL